MNNLDVAYDQVFFIDCLPEDEHNKWKISQKLMKFLADNGIIQTSYICRNKKLVIATLQHILKLATSGTKFVTYNFTRRQKCTLDKINKRRCVMD